MVTSTQVLDTATRLVFVNFSLRDIVVVEVEIPEFQLGLGCRANGSKDDMTALGRPPDGVTCPVGEGAEKLEVTLASFKTVEADVSLDGNTRSRVSVVGIAGGDDGESFTFRFP